METQEVRTETVTYTRRVRQPSFDQMMPVRPYRGDTERLRAYADENGFPMAEALRKFIRKGLDESGY